MYKNLIFIVALNFQTEDLSMLLNTAMFNDNGQSGYILKVIFVNKILLKFLFLKILKPLILRDTSLSFDPNEDKLTAYKDSEKNRIIFLI
jgi:hypothetical protein